MRVAGQRRGVTDDEIHVGGLGPAFPFKDFGGEVGAQARFKVENDNGGVNGRKINYVGWGDDNNSPTRTSPRRVVSSSRKACWRWSR